MEPEVQVCLEGLPQVCVQLRPLSSASGRSSAHGNASGEAAEPPLTELSLQALQGAISQAFGFRSTTEFEVLDAAQLSSNMEAGLPCIVRVSAAEHLEEVECIRTLFEERQDFRSEVDYVQLALAAEVPLLRLHRAIAPAAGHVVARYFEAYCQEVEEAAETRDEQLRQAAGEKAWRSLRNRVEAVFPGLMAHLPDLERRPDEAASLEERQAACGQFFNRLLDEVRLRLHPLRHRALRLPAEARERLGRVLGSAEGSQEEQEGGDLQRPRLQPLSLSAPDFTRPMAPSKRLLRVVWRDGDGLSSRRRARGRRCHHNQSDDEASSSEGSGSEDERRHGRQDEEVQGTANDGVFVAVLGGDRHRHTSTPEDRTDVLPLELRPHGGLTGHDLYYQVAKFFRRRHVQVRTKDGKLVTLDDWHKALLGRLPCDSEGLCVDLEASRWRSRPGSFDHLRREVLQKLGPRRFQLDDSYRLRLLTGGAPEDATVILIPVNFMEGKQMYLLRDPQGRQCKPLMCTFDEFKEVLSSLARVTDSIPQAFQQLLAERSRCASEERRILDKYGLEDTPMAQFDPPTVAMRWKTASLGAQASNSAAGLLAGLSASAAAEVDCPLHVLLKIPPAAMDKWASVERAALQWCSNWPNWAKSASSGRHGSTSGSSSSKYKVVPPGAEYAARAELSDPWSIAVGGLVGMIFGLLEVVHDRTYERPYDGAVAQRGMLSEVLERMVFRGSQFVSVMGLCQLAGRLLKRVVDLGSRQEGRHRKAMQASQAAVLLGTTAWTLCENFGYVQPSILRRVLGNDLTAAERYAAGIIWKSGVVCASTSGGLYFGAHFLGGGLSGGIVGALAGALVPVFISLFRQGLDWWQDRQRRRQMKAAALQTLGLPEPHAFDPEEYRSLLATRYRYMASCLHPDKNDRTTCDTTLVYSQVRLAREILEQELRDYDGYPRDRLRKRAEQMMTLYDHHQNRYRTGQVSDYPSGVIMRIHNAAHWQEDEELESNGSFGSLTTVESNSIYSDEVNSPTHSRRGSFDQQAPHDTPDTRQHEDSADLESGKQHGREEAEHAVNRRAAGAAAADTSEAGSSAAAPVGLPSTVSEEPSWVMIQPPGRA
eukprot:TRINITY_DN25439_c0_g2_i1.p1 TRINITY_DN25439_c0_g2~~TRINITY_DN25439_c0_g2_i1.p1  ORF type:complete len:1105 (+),score=245.05 TRINITY_DN25439_c0_g2_i1:293-3607(+)